MPPPRDQGSERPANRSKRSSRFPPLSTTIECSLSQNLRRGSGLPNESNPFGKRLTPRTWNSTANGRRRSDRLGNGSEAEGDERAVRSFLPLSAPQSGRLRQPTCQSLSTDSSSRPAVRRSWLDSPMQLVQRATIILESIVNPDQGYSEKLDRKAERTSHGDSHWHIEMLFLLPVSSACPSDPPLDDKRVARQVGDRWTSAKLRERGRFGELGPYFAS